MFWAAFWLGIFIIWLVLIVFVVTISIFAGNGPEPLPPQVDPTRRWEPNMDFLEDPDKTIQDV